MALIPVILQNGTVADANEVMAIFTEIFTNIDNTNIAAGAGILWSKSEALPTDEILVGVANVATPSATLPAALVGAIDHGGLSGLGDDDHTQYSPVDGTRAFTGKVAGVATGGGDPDETLTSKGYVDAQDTATLGSAQAYADTVDHGGLAGLGDDDHPQYTAVLHDEIVSGDWSFLNAVKINEEDIAPIVGQVASSGTDDIILPDSVPDASICYELKIMGVRVGDESVMKYIEHFGTFYEDNAGNVTVKNNANKVSAGDNTILNVQFLVVGTDPVLRITENSGAGATNYSGCITYFSQSS